MNPYKTVRFKGTEEEISAQWRNARKDGIGGSEASAVLGLNPYATPYTVWLEKTERMAPEDISDKESVYWGTVLEDVIAKEFAKRHPEMKVKRSNAMLWSTENPFMFASVDRIITDEKGARESLRSRQPAREGNSTGKMVYLITTFRRLPTTSRLQALSFSLWRS